MNDLPAGWARAKVGDLAESVQSGFASGQHNREGIGIPHLRPMNVGRDGRLNLADLRFVEQADGPRLQRGDVLFNNTNSAELVGKTTWVDVDQELAFSNHMTRLRLPDDVSPAFVARQLHHLWSRGAFEVLCNNHVSQASVSARTLSEQVELLVPPAAEQKRIVAKIEELTARSRRAKEALDAVPPLLDQLRQSILAAAFRGDLSADWRAKNRSIEPATEMIQRIRGTSAGTVRTSEYANLAPSTPLLPEGWSWTTVKEVANVLDPNPSHRYPTYIDGSIPLVSTREFEGREGWNVVNTPLVPKEVHTEQDRRCRFSENDIIFARKGRLGLARRPPLAPYVFSHTMFVIKCLWGCSEYLLWFLRRDATVDWLSTEMNSNTGVPTLGKAFVENLPLPMAPLEEQRVITQRIGAVFRMTDQVEAELMSSQQQARMFTDAVLAKAFRGELVCQDPNDEPASALLERIRARRTSAEGTASRASRQPRRVGPASEAAEQAVANDVTPIRLEPAHAASKDLNSLDPGALLDQVFAALWTVGPLERDEAVRRVGDHLREAGHVQFERLRSDGPLFASLLDTIESAVKAGRLDRPRRGHVRACKPDPSDYTTDDWRHALVASLGPEPIDRDDALRAAAEWARDNLGLVFTRLRADGQILEGLRSALNSAIRRGEVLRHDARLISRAPASAQPTPVRAKGSVS